MPAATGNAPCPSLVDEAKGKAKAGWTTLRQSDDVFPPHTQSVLKDRLQEEPDELTSATHLVSR